MDISHRRDGASTAERAVSEVHINVSVYGDYDHQRTSTILIKASVRTDRKAGLDGRSIAEQGL